MDPSATHRQESSCDSQSCDQSLVIADPGTGDRVELDDLYVQSWSPDGSELAVNMVSEGEISEPGVFLVDADGTDLRQITEEPDVWSGDGGWLAFTRPGAGWDEETGGVGDLELWIVRVDGTGARRVATGTNNFDWQHPDPH